MSKGLTSLLTLSRSRRSSRICISLLIFSFSCLALIPILSFAEVFQVSEAREGVVVQRMLSHAEYVIPFRHGEIVASKPPFFHWLGVFSSKLTDNYGVFELRLPSAIAAGFLLAALFLFVSHLSNTRSGLIASLVLATCYGFSRLATDGRVDMVFNACLSCAIAFSAISITEEREEGGVKRALLGGVFLGFSVLSKGPLAVFILCLVVGLFAIFERQGRRALGRLPIVLGACFLLSVPWYLAACVQGGEAFVSRQLFFENVSRIVGGAGITVRSPFFYLPHIFTQGAPWSLLAVVLLLVVF